MALVSVRRRALEDLRRILDDLETESKDAAQGLADRVTHTLELLTNYPRAGRHEYPESDREYRSIGAGPYRLWYRVIADDEAAILVIRHGRQRPPTLHDLEQRAEPTP
jgi:plasmid stabilization system protein ParE